MSVRKTHDIFINELRTIQPSIEVLGEYSSSHEHIAVKCAVCGHVWEALPTNLLKGRNCPKCSLINKGQKHRKDIDDVLASIKKNNPSIEIVGEYEKTSSKVLAKCKNCSYEWMVLPSALQRGSGCPRCARTGTSFVEQIILLSLEKITSTKVLSRNHTMIGLELDIFIPEKNFAVEYGAWPWHSGKEARDSAKIKLCAEKNIKLIEIFDAYPGESHRENNIWYYKENISRASNISIVKNIIIELCQEMGVPYTLSEQTFEDLKYQAHLNARRMTTDELNERLNNEGRNIVVLNEYQDMLTKVHAKCLLCGNEWDVIPASLIRGLGCPKCAKLSTSRKLKKTNEQFVREVEISNNTVEVLDKYIDSHTKIRARCKIHNIIWECLPSALISGTGCPQCRNMKIQSALRKTHEQFVEEIHNVNPNINIVGQYINSRTKLNVKCRICSNEWSVIPCTLQRGAGCPKCGRINQAGSRKKSSSEFSNELKMVNPNVEIIDEYVNSKTKIAVRCKECNYEWAVSPTSLLRGSGCPKCAGNMRKTHERFVSEMKSLNPNILIKGTYKNAKTNILVQCMLCNYEWEPTPTNLLFRNECPSCKKTSIT